MISLFLVEDERIARESIRDNVPWQEHDILFLGDAPDGEVALPQLLEKRPDILLTDIKMPFMDGLELARIVRKELPDTRIIILSGHNEFEYARKAITLGVNDYLLKPVSSRDILEAVDRSKAQILECRARRIERQSHSITQRELFFSNLYSGILMGPAQMFQRAAQLDGEHDPAQFIHFSYNACRFHLFVPPFVCLPRKTRPLRQPSVSPQRIDFC